MILDNCNWNFIENFILIVFNVKSELWWPTGTVTDRGKSAANTEHTQNTSKIRKKKKVNRNALQESRNVSEGCVRETSAGH